MVVNVEYEVFLFFNLIIINYVGIFFAKLFGYFEKLLLILRL